MQGLALVLFALQIALKHLSSRIVSFFLKEKEENKNKGVGGRKKNEMCPFFGLWKNFSLCNATLKKK